MSSNQSSPARRAIGAMFFALFGGVWLMGWAYQAVASPLLPCAFILLGAGLLLALAYRRYAKYRMTEKKADAPSHEKTRRVFYIINAAQWIIVLVVINVLANLGLSQWAIPAVMFMVGAHFELCSKVVYDLNAEC